MVVSINGQTGFGEINKFISNMPIADSRYLQKKYTEINPDLDFTCRYECSSCNHQNEGGVPITGDFFWPDG